MPVHARWMIRVAAAASAVWGAAITPGQRFETRPRVAIEPRTRAAPAAGAIRHATFRLDARLVQIPVTVTDSRDRPVLGLKKSDFRLFEDEMEQQVAAFSMADAALTAGLVFDNSGSMRGRLPDSREAIGQFLGSAVPGDEFFLVRFNDNPQLLVPLTASRDEITRSLSLLQPRGWTAMNDAIVRSLEEMRRAGNARRVLLVLTDGADNNSRYSESELLSMMREASVSLFAVGLFERPRFLEKLAGETGGGIVWVRKLAELPEAMDKLSVQIRNQYLVGYFSDHAGNDGRYHKVRVDVQPPPGLGPVRASWRRGYVAP